MLGKADEKRRMDEGSWRSRFDRAFLLSRLKPDSTLETASSPTPPLPDPDALLRRIDQAIAAAEYSYATHCLSALSSDLNSDTNHSGNPQKSPNSSTKPISNPQNPLTAKLIITPHRGTSSSSTLKTNNGNSLGTQIGIRSGEIMESEDSLSFPNNLKSEIASSKSKLKQSSTLRQEFSNSNGTSSNGRASDPFDARAADEAYRAGCSAYSSGELDTALSFLRIALTKCPPEKHAALAKIERLIDSIPEPMQKKESSTSQADRMGKRSATQA